MESVAEPVDPHPLVSLVSACFWVILWLLSWVKALVAFSTITVPRLIYAILSYSMTLTLNFWSFAIMFALSAVALNYWIRFRYLNDYTQLKEPPLVKPDATELHPDVNTDPAPTFHNYLDDFLQAVRVFGFLEKPVFHELARHLQTRRLIAGDSMSLEQDKSFYCVVDGMVQVFAHTGQPDQGQQGLWDHEDMNGYQLLNEVGSGGTLSSLFTILSLFTEDVKMSWQNDHDESSNAAEAFSVPRKSQRDNADVSRFDLGQDARTRRSSISSTASTVHPFQDGIPNHPEYTRPMSPIPDDDDETTASLPRSHNSHTARHTRIHEGVVARASEDSTLAVIPAEAFRRLTKKYPKATGHIVQVILTRFSRVTFNAAHRYLGLTSEVLRTEKAINDIACHPLPPSFYEGGGLQYLRQRFDGASTTDSDTDYLNASESTNTLSGKTLSESPRSSKVQLNDPPRATRLASSTSQTFKAHGRNSVQAGDLLSSTTHAGDFYRPISGSISTPRVPRGVKPLESRRIANLSGDEFDLREEVMSCIAKSIGLLQPPLSGTESAEASPAISPSDGRRSSGLFTPSFSSLSLLDIGDDASSVTGGASSSQSIDGYMSGLDNEVEMLFFAAGTTLVKAGEVNTGLFYVIEGFLDILLPTDDLQPFTEQRPSSEEPRSSGPKAKRPEQKLLFTVKPGGIAGYLASLCNTASYVDIKAKTDTYVGFLPSHALERLLEKRPIVLLTLAKRLISLLSPLVLHIDASLDWMQVNAGQVLWRPQDISDSFYIVINGRLRAISESEDGSVSIVGEYGQGDTVGEVDVITSSLRRNTLHAIRDTELIRMPQTLFNAISARNPQITAQILRMIATRVRVELDSKSTKSRSVLSEPGYNNNLKTVAVLPVSRSVPIDAFSRKLQTALEGIGATTSYLNQASISNQLGRHAFTRMGKLKAAGWLADQEQRYRTVLYVADSPVNSPWTQTCIRQADCIMVVGMGEDPSIGEYERLLLSMKTTARKELVLLHPDRSVMPGSTREWLKNRPWVHQHIHVELPGLVLPIPKVTVISKGPDAVTALKNLKDKVQSEIQKYRGGHIDPRPQRSPRVNDFSRLARRICGRSIGLILGGGGARGIAHLGLIRALEEYGIPIDHVGGTSIGALIGGLYAREGDILYSAGRAKQFSSRMGNIWRMLSDVTYPIVAYTTGHEFNRSLYKAFYDLHIEDMWLPFFCNTTNINTSEMEIHETGYAWRFIRASMTLVGLLPPLCDNGHMHVDGGYIDNLPVSAMFSMGTNIVFACDVGSLDDNSPRNFGDHVSGWWLLLNRWNPFSNARNVPAITEIQSRLAYVSSVKTLEDAKVAPGCFYIAMPVHEYGTLQFGKFEEIQKLGYHAAMKTLEKLDEEGRLPSALIDGKDSVINAKRKGQSARRNSI
ncbi:patatin-domain-containing protein [Armillaria solidipes]|uniref:Lysophospholipase NTE1 n=1 Tax=Armillaria solidipes TaxID=1076256 RepID=A0A2H3C1C7_9AGAR|nr:patatin-domain-containing protein [Armillaria solidipes]